MIRIIPLLLFVSVLSSLTLAQDSEGMERLLYEFPHGRPAYSPLVNEIEVAPRMDLWKRDNSLGVYYGIDMEYALSKKIILETGISNLNTETNLPAFIQEPGLELGAFYTILNHSDFVLTFGMEGQMQLDNEINDKDKYSIEPMVIAATTINKFQIHLGINSEISSSIKPGFYIAGIYNAGYMRPFIEMVKLNEGNNSLVLTPGFVIPVYEEMHLGIGMPFANKNGITTAGISLFISIELGEEE